MRTRGQIGVDDEGCCSIMEIVQKEPQCTVEGKGDLEASRPHRDSVQSRSLSRQLELDHLLPVLLACSLSSPPPPPPPPQPPHRRRRHPPPPLPPSRCQRAAAPPSHAAHALSPPLDANPIDTSPVEYGSRTVARPQHRHLCDANPATSRPYPDSMRIAAAFTSRRQPAGRSVPLTCHIT